ncbi:MAG TPA: hypothetical protein VEC01_11740 [Noviherbaspirillum sp.]|uniref:hypothetical protein n=1 Tax=Noviherbaspirillum sp. TaxID=1926288 RepID=UPI002D280A3F|nr:hypothetical protein [Noviherbaspirillum sp.]HYD95990.1 hypothetical protein [Noviherbaspirillum sp.]
MTLSADISRDYEEAPRSARRNSSKSVQLHDLPVDAPPPAEKNSMPVLDARIAEDAAEVRRLLCVIGMLAPLTTLLLLTVWYLAV